MNQKNHSLSIFPTRQLKSDVMSRKCAVQGCDTLYDQDPTNAESHSYLDAVGPSGPWSVSGINVTPSSSKEIFICKRHIETGKREFCLQSIMAKSGPKKSYQLCQMTAAQDARIAVPIFSSLTLAVK